MREKIEPLVSFEHPNANVAFVQWLERSTSLTMRRLRRMTGPRSRTLGYSYMDVETPDSQPLNVGSASSVNASQEYHEDIEYDLFDDEGEFQDARPTPQIPSAVERDSASGFPLAVEEFLLSMFKAGFHPKSQVAMQRGLTFLLDMEIRRAVHAYDISMKKAVLAWIIPGWQFYPCR